MYPDESKWESDLKEALEEANAIAELQDHLTESPEPASAWAESVCGCHTESGIRIRLFQNEA